MSLKEKLLFIQVNLKAPKNLYNSFGNYNYRNAEGILNAVKPYLDDNKVSLTLSDCMECIGDRIYVKATATLHGFKKGVSALGGITVNGMKTITAGITAGVTAAAGGIAAIGTAAVSAYADYEQLVGGVETLFGAGGQSVWDYADSVGKSVNEVREEYGKLMIAQNEVMDNASKAYKTAGLSANEYMETVSGFAASLKQSTSSELEAAQIADQAVIDMADNANKMGTSMESIQNAYQGFAKQNYTMLDNLKLGYGGTKSEMERLLADATALSGVEYDLDSLSDVYSAIHVIQDELGITGTTAKEASTTIQGSVGAMKASWQNLLIGVADDNQNFDQLVEDFVNSVGTVAENILPRVEIALDGVGNLVEELVPIIIDRIPELANDVLPDLIQSGVNMISSIVTGLNENLPELLSGGAEILNTLSEGILSLLPMLGEAAYNIITTLISGITDNADSVFSSGSEILLNLVNGIAEKLPDLLSSGVDAVISLAMAITEPGTLTNIITAGINLLVSLVDGILNALPKLLEAAPIIIARLVSALISNAPQLLKAAVHILVKLAEFMISNTAKLLAAVPKLFTSLVNNFKEMDWGSIGKNIIDGIWSGIQAGWDWLTGNVKNLATNLFNAAKDALGIHSPSRKFKYLGEMCVAGFDDGIQDLMSTDGITKNINASISTGSAGISGNGTSTGLGSFNQTINVNQQISTPDELARAVRVESKQGLMRGAYGY